MGTDDRLRDRWRGRGRRSYQRELRKLRELVRSAEWVQPAYNGSPSCPFCGAQQHHNHHAGCPMPHDLRAPLVLDTESGEWK